MKLIDNLSMNQKYFLVTTFIGLVLILGLRGYSYYNYGKDIQRVNSKLESIYTLNDSLLRDDLTSNLDKVVYNLNRLNTLNVNLLDLKIDLVELKDVKKFLGQNDLSEINYSSFQDSISLIENTSGAMRPLAREVLNTMRVLEVRVDSQEEIRELVSLSGSLESLVKQVGESSLKPNLKGVVLDDLEVFRNEVASRLKLLNAAHELKAGNDSILNRKEVFLNSINLLRVELTKERNDLSKSFTYGLILEFGILSLFLMLTLGGGVYLVNTVARKANKKIRTNDQKNELKNKMINMLQNYVNLPVVVIDDNNKIKWGTHAFFNLLTDKTHAKKDWESVFKSNIVSTTRETNLHNTVKFRSNLTKDYSLKTNIVEQSDYKKWKVYMFVELSSYYRELASMNDSIYELYPQLVVDHLEFCEVVSAFKEVVELSSSFVGVGNVDFNTTQLLPYIVNISEVSFRKKLKPLIDGIFAFSRLRSSRPILVDCSYLDSGINISIMCQGALLKESEIENEFGFKGRSYSSLMNLFKMFESSGGSFNNSVAISNIKNESGKHIRFSIKFQLTQKVITNVSDVDNRFNEINQ